jgi:sugar phosphate permease
MRYRVLAAGCSVAVLIYIHRQSFAVALKDIQNTLSLSTTQAGWLVFFFMIAYGLFEMPAGLLGDRYGVRHVLPILVLGWSLTTALVALVVWLPEVWYLPFIVLLLLRFLFGMFQAGGFPLLSRMMTDWMTTKERASAQGAVWMSTRFGGMVAAPLVGGLVFVFGDWRYPLCLLSALGLVWCCLFWPWFRNRPEEKAGVNPAECELIAAGRAPRATSHAIPWDRMLRCRSVWFLCLTYGCGAFAANFYVTLLPAYLQNIRKLTEEETIWLSSLPFACGAVSCLVGGLLSDWFIRRTGNRKWGRRLNGTLSMAVGGIGWFLVPVAPDAVTLALVLCLIFFCNDLGIGPAWASCADVGERYAGTLGGAMNMVGSLAGALGGLIAGKLFGTTMVDGKMVYEDNPVVFIIYGCSFLLAALCWQGVDVTKTLADDATAA